MTELTRRSFLLAGVVLGVGTLAACTSPEPTDHLYTGTDRPRAHRYERERSDATG
ncbi:hypothetical protein [Hoyosella altamirensis]|uniref:Uncharacterized protein n=1 Tax=Hoyosella altamirensis TaxID=616997 RepID=A0A839RP49_9ACTN|nr:hypothetical protein [Hoyosella altamirensis]MBB3038079.1 hypothetical protein [Hoyosella altamirensis]